MEKTTIVAVILVAVFAIGIIAYLSPLRPLAVYGYAKSVPVQVDYNEVQKYWMLSATVDETITFKLVLEDGTTESIDGDDHAKTKSEVGLLIEPLQPYSETNLVATNLKYADGPCEDPTVKAPAFDVNDAGWLTTAVYELAIYKNGIEVSKQHVEVDYQKARQVLLETDEGTVTVNNLGILPQGVEVPSGDLIIVYDPDGNVHVFNKADFIYMLDQWNEAKSLEFPWFTTYTWKDVWDGVETADWLPQNIQLTHVAEVTYSEDLDSIKLTYVLGAFAGDISIYVPDDLADTIIVQLSDPNPEIVKVEPDPLPKIKEGESTVFWVTIENIGTRGTIYVSVSSDRYSFTPLTSSGKTMEAGEVATFKWEAYALNVEKDTKTQIKIFAQGRGGTDTYILEGEIEDVPGYTPDIPEPTYTVLIVHVVDGVSFQPISEISLTINVGGSLQAGTTNTEGTVQFDLGQYTGDVKITSQETAQYPSKTEIIRVQRGSNEHTMSLGFDWWSQYWWIILLIIAIIVVIAIAVYYYTRES